jgi:hypothetical protein
LYDAPKNHRDERGPRENNLKKMKSDALIVKGMGFFYRSLDGPDHPILIASNGWGEFEIRDISLKKWTVVRCVNLLFAEEG